MPATPTERDPGSRNPFHLDGIPRLALHALPVIEHLQSISAAAANLGVSQPAVSRAIATLEKHLGVPVLRRGRLPMTLTDEGARLAEFARREALLLADALRDVEDARRLRTGTIRIGSFGASASTRILPDLIAGFAKLHPHVAIEVREIGDKGMAQALRDGVVDVALLVDPDGDTFEVAYLATDQLIALLPGDVGPSVTARALAKMPFVMTKGGSEPLIRRWFARSGQVPDVRHEVQQISSILAFVRAGLGVAVIAELALPDDHHGIHVVPLAPPAPRQVVLARARTTPRTPSADAFWLYVEARQGV